MYSKYTSKKYQNSIYFEVSKIDLKQYQKSISSLKNFDASRIYKKSRHISTYVKTMKI